MITFTGGLILGLVIGAIVVTALWIYIIWSPVRGLRERCREAEKANERVRQANLDVMMHFDDMKAAKEKAEARVMELESGLEGIKVCIESEHPEHLQAAIDSIDHWMSETNSQAFIKRVQAEAVENFGVRAAEGDLDDPGEEGMVFAHGDVQTISDKYAQRLRSEADQLERGEGDE